MRAIAASLCVFVMGCTVIALFLGLVFATSMSDKIVACVGSAIIIGTEMYTLNVVTKN